MVFLGKKFSNENEIHLIKGSLLLKEAECKALLSILSESERRDFSSPQLSERHKAKISSRGLLREVLAFHLNISPENVPILVSIDGKPYLKETLKFNTTHAQNHVVYALSLNGELGVDIENSKRQFNSRLVKKVFHPIEQEYFHSQKCEADRNRAFFEIWTSKEAYLKALGTGIRVPLNAFYFNRETQTFVKTESGLNPIQTDWHCYFKHLPDDSIISLVTQQKKPEIQLFDGEWDL